MSGRMVLSDELLVVYENMHLEPKKYRKKYRKLMKLLILPYETNKDQLIRAKKIGLNDEVYNRLLPALAVNVTKDYDLNRLASTTSLKLILTTEENVTLPYINLNSKLISNQLTISIRENESRAELVKYLQGLSATANKITICDNYFAKNWITTQSLFLKILPRHSLQIEFVETPQSLAIKLNSSEITGKYVQSVYNGWQVSKSELYQNSHDRYLLIESSEGKIEVMLSSGFEHIWKNNPKEITCVFREIG